MAYYMTNPIKTNEANFRLFGNNSYLFLCITEYDDKVHKRVKPAQRYSKDDIEGIREYIKGRLDKLGYTLDLENIDKLINELLSLRTNCRHSSREKAFSVSQWA